MLVGHISMGVAHLLVPMRMTMPACGHRMTVSMVRIVMLVRMLVFDRVVLVLVRVALGQVEDDAGHHQRGPEQHPEAAAAVTAIKASLAPSPRCTRASCSIERRKTTPINAAPEYRSAAVVKLPTPTPNGCTSGVLTPKRTAAVSASNPPRSAGHRDTLDSIT